MDQDPLVAEQLDAGAKFIGEFNNYAPVGAAFWLKESDSGHWYLYIASDRLDGEKIADAYGEVLRLNKELADPNFDPFQVKLIPLDHPLAKAAPKSIEVALGRFQPVTTVESSAGQALTKSISRAAPHGAAQ